MTIGTIKGLLFVMLLILAAVCDLRKREIPDIIPFLILITGFLSINLLDAFLGLVLTGLPYLLAAVLIQKESGLSMGGGDIKLMAACGFVLGVPFGALQSIISLIIALVISLCARLFSSNRKLSSITLPLAPFFCVGGIFSYSALLLSAIN